MGSVAAGLGVPVFPCGENKRPLTTNGFKAATDDKRAILEMFDREAAVMIGMPTGWVSGLVAIDVDIRDDRTGMDWLNAHSEMLPPTRTHKTRSGGLHLIFKMPSDIDVRSSASRLAPGIDVRGNGGYIVLPPSPGYQVADMTPPAEMPPWLVKACCKPAPEIKPIVAVRTAPRPDGGSAYGLAALQRECDAIRSAGYGQQEHTINASSLKIGALVGGGEIDESIALSDLLSAGRNVSSQPGREAWGDGEIDNKIRRAFVDGKATPRTAPIRPTASFEPPPHMADFDPGYYSSLEHDADEDLEPADPTAELEQEAKAEEAKKDTPKPGLSLVWFDEIEPVLDARDFVQGVLLEEGAAVIYGESNAGKTFWATDLALHVAAGEPWCDRRVEQGGVVYCVLEGGIGFRNRVSAWKSQRDLAGEVIPFAAITSSLNLLDPDADTPRLIDAVKLAAETIKSPVKLIVIDTLSRAMAGGNENAPDDMGALVRNMDRIRAETGACVMFIHHSGKDQAKGARGHSSLRAAIDTEIEVVADEGGAKTATVVKQREMKKGDAFEFTLRVVELGTNRHGEAVTTCLVDYGATGQAAGAASEHRARLKGHNKRALEVLDGLITASGRTGDPGVPSGCLSVPEKWWRDRFYESAMPGAETATKTRTFSRVGSYLVETHRVGMGGGRVWSVSYGETQPDKNQDKKMSGEYSDRNEQ